MFSGANVSDEECHGRTPLHDSVENGDLEMTALLLRNGGADPIAKDANDLTPYDIAFNKRNQEVVFIYRTCLQISMYANYKTITQCENVFIENYIL